MRKYIYGILSQEIQGFAKYYDSITQVDKHPWDDEIILDNVMHAKKSQGSLEDFDISQEDTRDVVICNGLFNYSYNIQDYLLELRKKSNRNTRVAAVVYNFYLSWLYRFASLIGLRKGEPPKTFVTHRDLLNITKLSNFDTVYYTHMVFIPFSLFGFGDFLNKILSWIPIVNKFALVSLYVLRPVKNVEEEKKDVSVSIIIPARNEKGNIENALKRIPKFAKDREIVFVEGNSSDGTWEEIQRVSELPEYKDQYSMQIMQQPGKGKYDAVKVGFAAATKDLLMILDADLTMPPELLPQFYNAYCEGKGDFINGSRLVYPMEGEAMRPLNLLGNKFFAKALSFLLQQTLTDSLCGTKVLLNKDYDRVIAWRNDFGDFDPFGDFELLFSASELMLGIIDVPVRYRDRTYGSTQISRFRDGFTLLKMTTVALFKIRFKKF